MESSQTSSVAWWQPRRVDVGTGVRWTLGGLALSVLRGPAELQLVTGVDAAGDGATSASVETIADLPAAPDLHQRYAVSGAGRSIQCLPRLADRAVVVRPRLPLFLPAGERMTIFVSSPIWLELRVGAPGGQSEIQSSAQADLQPGRWTALAELPVKRLSDTWFGSSTRDGELAYSLETQARTQLEEVTARAHRAITRVVVHNRAADPLSLDRLNLPVPFLSVYATGEAHLWTEGVRMTRGSDAELAQMQVDSGPPPEAGAVDRVSGPRAQAESHVLVRAFSSLLHNLAGDPIDE